MVTKVDKWKLMHHDPLPTWTHPTSTMVLIGDACHPMLPYLAQGANISIEDGSVLGLVLSTNTNSTVYRSRKDLPAALRMFEALRKERGEGVTRETFAQRRDFHLKDGEEQRERDAIFMKWLGREDELEKSGVRFPSQWSCPVRQKAVWGYDAKEAVEEYQRGR